ncbi:MAG: amidase [Spirochaetota bacterium]
MPDPSLGPLVDRLRQNLGSAGIAVMDEDLDAMAEKGFLNSILAFEVALRGIDCSTVPEYPMQPSPDVGSAGPIDGIKVDSAKAVYRRDPGSAGGILAAGIFETAERLRSGEISPLDLIEASFERIAERDPSINAFQSFREEEARDEARVAEGEIHGGRALGPLHGIPIAVKDLLDIEGMATTAGSRILAGSIAERDSVAVARLRAEGAIIVGKTCMPEFAYSPGSNNDHYGPTCNPRDLTRDSGGSSSGSAAAVADGMVFAAVGSDTGGSIRIPASFCGVVGWKPAWGKASLAGAMSLSWSLDTLGALARNVRDAALICAARPALPAARRCSASR